MKKKSLSPDKVTVTPLPNGESLLIYEFGPATMKKLLHLRELLADEIPSGDFGEILKYALRNYIEVETERLAREGARTSRRTH